MVKKNKRIIEKFILNEKGSVIVELALTLPLILLLVFGYIFYMKGVETHLIMQTAAREGARAYANPIYGIEMSSYAKGVASRELSINNIKGATVTSFVDGMGRGVSIEKPYAVRFPMNQYILKTSYVFHAEPYDEDIEDD